MTKNKFKEWTKHLNLQKYLKALLIEAYSSTAKLHTTMPAELNTFSLTQHNAKYSAVPFILTIIFS